jgi:hypothetical protein
MSFGGVGGLPVEGLRGVSIDVLEFSRGFRNIACSQSPIGTNAGFVVGLEGKW